MTIISLECKNCEAKLKIDDSRAVFFCEYCGVKHIMKEVISNQYRNNSNITFKYSNTNNPNDFEIISGKLIKYKGISSHVVIPDSIRIIGKKSFSDSSIESVMMPNSIIEIEANAFSNCKYLKKITFSDNIKTIGEFAFSNCESLEKIIFPNGLKSIGNFVFWHCKNLEEIYYPDSVEVIGHDINSKCNNLKKVHFSKNAKGIYWPNSPSLVSITGVSISEILERIYGRRYGVFALPDSPLRKELLEKNKKKICIDCGGQIKGFFNAKCQKCGKDSKSISENYRYYDSEGDECLLQEKV